MLKLVVLIFENEIGAQGMLGYLQTLQRQQLISVSDAAFIIRQKDGKVKVKQANKLVGSGVLGGAFWGLFIGRYFWQLWMTQTTQAVTETAVDNYLDCGIDDDFLKEVTYAIKPEHSALFMLVPYLTDEKLSDIALQSDIVLYTTLSIESDAKLREAFGILEEE